MKIGFVAEEEKKSEICDVPNMVLVDGNKNEVKKSVVDVVFHNGNKPLAYYNDKFNLKKGDIVFVEGKFDGVAGKVVDINYTFKIKLDEYKRIVSVADTDINGEFKFALSELLTLNKNTIPFKKIAGWFGIGQSDEEFITSVGDESYDFYNLGTLDITPAVAERGHDYFINDKVVYVEYDACNVRAVVKGTEYYEVEFNLNNGKISCLVCNCPCSGICKHEFAVLLQIRSLIDEVYKIYGENYEFDYFAAVNKSIFYDYVLSDKDEGTLVVS